MFNSQQVDEALALILDTDYTHRAIQTRAIEILGRKPNDDRDEDTEWWEAMTSATNELLIQVQAANLGSTH